MQGLRRHGKEQCAATAGLSAAASHQIGWRHVEVKRGQDQNPEERSHLRDRWRKRSPRRSS